MNTSTDASNGPTAGSRHDSFTSQASKDSTRYPRSASFKDSDKYERTKSGTFVRRDSDAFHTSDNKMPDFRQSIKERLAKTRDQLPQGLMKEVLQTYKPHILGRRRQLIEDCVRDLRLNNDHIHIVEQEMRRSIEVRYTRAIIKARLRGKTFSKKDENEIKSNYFIPGRIKKGNP